MEFRFNVDLSTGQPRIIEPLPEMVSAGYPHASEQTETEEERDFQNGTTPDYTRKTDGHARTGKGQAG